MRQAAWIAGALMLLYVAAYFLLQSNTPERVSGETLTFHHFRVGGEHAELLFQPLLMLDRKIRPMRWRNEEVARDIYEENRRQWWQH